MLLRSVRRAESRALAKYPFMEIKPMVQSMVSMVMTTMSSIRVKAHRFIASACFGDIYNVCYE